MKANAQFPTAQRHQPSHIRLGAASSQSEGKAALRRRNELTGNMIYCNRIGERRVASTLSLPSLLVSHLSTVDHAPSDETRRREMDAS